MAQWENNGDWKKLTLGTIGDVLILGSSPRKGIIIVWADNTAVASTYQPSGSGYILRTTGYGNAVVFTSDPLNTLVMSSVTIYVKARRMGNYIFFARLHSANSSSFEIGQNISTGTDIWWSWVCISNYIKYMVI